MKTPSKAMILAAGFGERLAPLTRQTPKTLLPFWGRPVLERTLDMLETWGVRDVLINLHHAPNPILAFLRQRPSSSLRIAFSYEPDILGTGGALRKAEWFLHDDFFWIINGDVVADLSPSPLLRCFHQRHPLAVLWLNNRQGPRTVDMRANRISNFHSASPGTPDTYTFCGLHLASRKVLDFLPEKQSSSIIDAYSRAMQEGHDVCGVCPSRAFWADIGTPADYLDAHGRAFASDCACGTGGRRNRATSRETRRGVTGWVSLGVDVRIESGARIHDSVVHDHAVLKTRTRLDRAIVGEGATVAGPVRGMALRADCAASPSLLIALDALKWPSHDTTLLPFAPRGSARSFARIVHGRDSAIVIEYSLERPENALYVQNARFLRALGVRVPRVILDRPDIRLTVMEDVGSTSLQDRIAGRSPGEILRIYQSVMAAILPMYENGGKASKRQGLQLCEPFGRKLYRWERDLFVCHFLRDHLHLSTDVIRSIASDLDSLASTLLHEPPVLIHRDLQSSNVLFLRHIPVFIDFQGMRLGSALYDLASLICDPYVSLPESVQNDLIAYCARSRTARSGMNVDLFWIAAIQRLSQAIGAFARLSHRRETAPFARHIPPALKMLDRALKYVDNRRHLKKLVSGLLADERGCV